MSDCLVTDFQFPMYADVYYSVSSQGAYGDVQKVWTKDRTTVCYLSPAGSQIKEEISPNVDLTLDSLLVGRFKEDIRFSSSSAAKAVLNILITEIKNNLGNPIYIETSGPRKDESTLYEIATFQPVSGPFGGIEYYKAILRRSENQGLAV